MLRTGFILNRRDDLLWFWALPLAAVAFALASQRWLPFVALASVTLWVTMPHQFASWLRAYGHAEDWQRWKGPLVVGPAVLLLLALAGTFWAPLTLLLLVMLWDHQHSLMQQHGFARIYDFKAHTGAPSTRNFDLALNWILYGNLVLTAPLFTMIWVRELYRWNLPVSVVQVERLQTISVGVLAGYLIVYAGHLVWSVRRGYAINPLKYVFLAASYFLWYFTAWATTSVLAYGIAHRLMHGLQYIVIVYWFLRRKGESQPPAHDVATWLTRPGRMPVFVAACMLYTVLLQILLARPWEEFAFGLLDFNALYLAVPEFGLVAMDPAGAYQVFAAILIDSLTLTHYYLDSFIWKVRDRKVQGGL